MARSGCSIPMACCSATMPASMSGPRWPPHRHRQPAFPSKAATISPAARSIVNNGTITAKRRIGGAVGAHRHQSRIDPGQCRPCGAGRHRHFHGGFQRRSSSVLCGGRGFHGGKVTNTGKIIAPGGHMLLTARAAAGVQDAVINNSGMVEATSVREENGEIILEADDGAVSNSGTLDASGKGAGETGGTVKILGKDIAVTDGAKIHVSGDAGGGTVLIGGNFQGTGASTRQTATVGKAASRPTPSPAATAARLRSGPTAPRFLPATSAPAAARPAAMAARWKHRAIIWAWPMVPGSTPALCTVWRVTGCSIPTISTSLPAGPRRRPGKPSPPPETSRSIPALSWWD